MSLSEHDIQNNIRMALAERGHMCFRINVGKVRTKDGRWFSTGAPKGFSDLFGVRKSDGKVFFIEVKTEKGRVRPEQKKFIKRMQELNAIAGIARSVEEAIAIVEGKT